MRMTLHLEDNDLSCADSAYHPLASSAKGRTESLCNCTAPPDFRAANTPSRTRTSAYPSSPSGSGVTLLERFVSDDVRAAARCNGNFVTPIIESVRTPARITPYPTGRCDRAQLIPEVFLVEMCAVFPKEGFRIRNFVTPIIESVRTHTCTNHTVPYGTALWGGAVPGTSCQATIAPSLRDISR